MTTEALYLGERGQELFGMMHLPGEAIAPRPPVLVVPPFGFEAVWCHRSLRLMAERLSGKGHLTLRLDPFGTGDSAGDDTSIDLVERWIESVVHGVRHLRAVSGETVLVVGTRLGALLALAAAARLDSAVRGGALIVPVREGRAFVRELKAFRMMQAEGVQKPIEGTEEAAGYIVRKETILALGRLKALELPVSGDWLVYTLADGAAEAPLAKHLGAESRPAVGYSAMMQEQGRSIPPETLIDDLARWFSEKFGEVASRALEPMRGARRVACLDAPEGADRGEHGVVEQPLRLGARKLFSIVASPREDVHDARESGRLSLTEPVAKARSAAVILLNWGSAYHVGATRLPVSWSRTLASNGYRVARLDLGGIGETPPRPGQKENDAYATTTTSDVREAMMALRERFGHRRFVLMGLCAGAWTSFHSALAEDAVVGAVLINTLEFYFREGMSTEVVSSKARTEADRYARAAFSPEKWTKLVKGDVDLQNLARVVRKRGEDVAKARVKRLFGRYAPGDNIARDLHRLGEAGKKIALVFSEGEAGLAYLRSNLGREGFERLRARHDIELRVFEGADHTFSPIWTQPLLTHYVTSFMLRRFPER